MRFNFIMNVGKEKKENGKKIPWSGRGRIPKWLKGVVVPGKNKKEK